MEKMTSKDKEILYKKLGPEFGPCVCDCEQARHVCTSSRELKQDVKFNMLKSFLTILAAALFGLAVLHVCYAFYQPNKCTSTPHPEAALNRTEAAAAPVCTGIPAGQRSDCWPQTAGASQQSCTSKTCCWGPAPKELGDVPYCYYPKNPAGYVVQSSKQTPLGMSYTLTRSTPSGWPADINTLTLDILYETQQRLRFKIYDPNNRRYEVPIRVAPHPSQPPSSMDYQVVVSAVGSPFSLTVKRKSTGQILFSTVNAAPLIFADQFLQLGSVLSTNFVYGLGEHRAKFLLDVNWSKHIMWARDQPPSLNANLYGDHPFYLNIEPDNNAHGVFLLNSNAMGVELQPSPAVSFRTTGGILDFYVFSGPTSDNVVQQYTELIGRPFMPPYWALGFHLCRWGYEGADGMKKVIQRMRDAKMPYDTQWNDIDYMRAHLDWTYDKDQFGTLPQIVDDLHANGQHYIMIIDPGISSTQPSGDYPPWDDGLNKNVFIKKFDGSGPIIGKVWPGETGFPDFFHPNATAYWTKHAQDYHDKVKYDGIWIDMNEPSNFLEGSKTGCPDNNWENPPYIPYGLLGGKLRDKTLCATAKQFIDMHYNLHSLYGYSETVVTDSALQTVRPNVRSLVISRSTYPSSGVYGGHWLGDNNAQWSDLYYSIPGMMNFQLFGIPLVGSDICGFNGNTNPELCARWMQLGAFYPFMRNHNTKGDNDQDPAVFDENTQNIMRNALQTRYYLLPFLYTLFYNSHVHGTPVVRPLFFQYPASSMNVTYSLDVQFMWGSALLITPVTTQGTTKGKGYLPKDRWYDFYNHSAIDSPGHYIMFDLPMEKMNIQIRGGSIFPLQSPDVTTTLSRKNKFGIVAALDTNGIANGELYWDDGEELGVIQSRNYNLIEFSAGRNSLKGYITHGGYKSEPMILGETRILGVQSAVTSVQVNGASYSQFTYKDQVLTVFGMSVDLLQTMTISWS